jgi:hypothetical protein
MKKICKEKGCRRVVDKNCKNHRCKRHCHGYCDVMLRCVSEKEWAEMQLSNMKKVAKW